MKKRVIDFYNKSTNLFIKWRFNLLIKPFLRRKPKYEKKYSLSICAIFKNEARFLREWIEYHSMVGIDHFYLYNNNSLDKFREVLQPYLDKGVVTLIDFPGEQMQLKAYSDFYSNYSQETQWVSFLDIDEFICPNSHLSIKDWIRAYERYPVILIYWKMFGTSGLMMHDDNKLVIEQYHVCWDSMYHVGKCFINTDYPVVNNSTGWYHEPIVSYPFLWWNVNVYPVNQFFKSSINELARNITSIEKQPSIQINHYWSKAWEFYEKKLEVRGAASGRKRTVPFFLWHENHNCTTDYNIYKYVMQLKLKMKGVE